MDRAGELSREALAAARGLGEPGALLAALNGRFAGVLGPEAVDERLSVASELADLAQQQGDGFFQARGVGYQTSALLDMGDMAGVDACIETNGRLAEEFHLPFVRYVHGARRAMRTLFEGRLADGERLSGEVFALGQQLQYSHTAPAHLMQRLMLEGTGRGLEGIGPLLEGLCEQYRWSRFWPCCRAWACCERGELRQARELFELVAEDGFTALGRETFGPLAAVALAARTCAKLEDDKRAAVLYNRLLPHARLNVGALAAFACYGSASRYLGLLATSLERWDEAAGHFEDALAMDEKMGARPWVALTQHDYATMLMKRGDAGDRERALQLVGEALGTAQELGMARLAEQCLALKMEVQGILEA